MTWLEVLERHWGALFALGMIAAALVVDWLTRGSGGLG